LELKVEQLSEKLDKLDRMVHMQATNIMLRLERLEQQMAGCSQFSEEQSTVGQQVAMLWQEVNGMWAHINDVDSMQVSRK
jgi:hypothetical protein